MWTCVRCVFVLVVGNLFFIGPDQQCQFHARVVDVSRKCAESVKKSLRMSIFFNIFQTLFSTCVTYENPCFVHKKHFLTFLTNCTQIVKKMFVKNGFALQHHTHFRMQKEAEPTTETAPCCEQNQSNLDDQHRNTGMCSKWETSCSVLQKRCSFPRCSHR